ncbi:MAG: GAF domain-containing protein [Anaerolineae bacterium]|nr:GAF domain-containing protein [Anaerolineae bacterium]
MTSLSDIDFSKHLQFLEILRLKALHDLELLTPGEEEFYNRFTRLAHEVLHVPVSLISMVADDYQYFKSEFGMEEPLKSQRQTPISHSFCEHIISTGQPLIIDNTRENPLVWESPAIQDYNIQAYLGLPLTLVDGSTLGSFCAIDHQPHEWDELDTAIMRHLSQIISNEFNARRKIYINPAARPELEELHASIIALIDGLNPSLPRDRFLDQLRAARRRHRI